MLGVRAWTVRVSENHVGLESFVFHWWWEGLFVPAATLGFAFSFVGLPLTATFLPISLDASPFHQLRRVEEYRKKRVRAAETLRKQVSHTV